MSTKWAPLVALTAAACSRKTQQSGGAPPASPAASTTKPRSVSVADARHVLNRLAFGPRPGEAAVLAAQGVESWLDAQLAPAGRKDAALDAALEPYANALMAPSALIEELVGDDWGAVNERKIRRMLKGSTLREHLGAIALAKLTRHVLSERQLEEVMVDFWTDHFNVFARKGAVRLFAGDYAERALRPHALGRFEDLLIATARHPAMLLYLDNARSVAARKAGRRGLNENYARELLELHTVGVHGGYSQTDVIEVARILTGWSVSRPQEGELSFRFRPRAHDDGEKKVLGVPFPAGGGEAEGITLLKLLAAHPKTAQHLATKLCKRLVSDTPPAALIESVASAFTRSGGDIKAMVRAIVASDAFWQPAARGAKLKSPLEVIVSSLRALGAKPDGSLRLAQVLARMGQPAMLESAPTGYPEVQAAWLGSSAMLGRMSFASALAGGRPLGADVDLESVLPAEPTATIAKRAAQTLFDGVIAQPELAAIDTECNSLSDAEQRRALCVALLLGGPSFQQQ
ncbi:MAG: DUF1800 domain-containing protein [Polyangiaceae bacterium]